MDEDNIRKIILGRDPQEHISSYELEWKRLGYIDERVYPNLFLLMLDDLPNYQILKITSYRSKSSNNWSTRS